MFKRPKLFDIIVCAGCVALMSWFAWHGLKGPRSVENYSTLEAELGKNQLALADIKDQREALEARVKLMRPESLDPDLASELVRKSLGYEKHNSILVKFE